MTPIRNLISFKSTAFNMTESKYYFINPGCFGDDVGRWLMGQLQQRGVQVDPELGQEDFGWYFTFWADGQRYDFVVSYREEDNGGDWLGWIERSAGFFASLFGGRKRGVQAEAMECIHRVLTESPLVSDVQWHDERDFDAGREEEGVEHPS